MMKELKRQDALIEDLNSRVNNDAHDRMPHVEDSKSHNFNVPGEKDTAVVLTFDKIQQLLLQCFTENNDRPFFIVYHCSHLFQVCSKMLQ